MTFDASKLITSADKFKSLQKAKLSELSAACARAIYAGAESSALGAAYHYPTDDKSQMNLTASITASLLPSLPDGWTTPFLCADAGGTWAIRNHTATQIQQVGKDVKAFIVAAQVKNATLAEKVMNAATSDAIAAITW